MTSEKSRIFLLITILITQIIVVKSQDVSVNPITPSKTSPEQNPTTIPISLTNHIIKVGYMDYGFSRNNFSVGQGDVLHWEWEGNLEHSVIESTLETPCQKKVGGFDLGRHTQPFNYTMAFSEVKTVVFFSDVSDDCAKGMYGGINLPQDYTWPNNLAAPPAQIVTTPLNPTQTPTPIPTVTGSMSIAEGTVTGSMTTAAGAVTGSMTTAGGPTKSAQESPIESKNSEDSSKSSSNSIYLKESIYGIVIGSLVSISLYFIMS